MFLENGTKNISVIQKFPSYLNAKAITHCILTLTSGFFLFYFPLWCLCFCRSLNHESLGKIIKKKLCMKRLEEIRRFLHDATYLLVTQISCAWLRQLMRLSVYLFDRRKRSSERLVFSWAVPFIVNDISYKNTVLQTFMSLKTAAAIAEETTDGHILN